ncbi:fatty acid oxygenase, partial [Aspergillus sclerotialis]
RPLPSQNGDGTYVEHETSTGWIQDLKTMGFQDFATLKDVLETELSGELMDDRAMVMERVIQ